MDGISKNAERIRAFLIGQIGKNTAIPNNPIKLKDLLSETYAVLTEAKALVGGRLIILECENTPKLIELYQQHDFTLIELAGDTKPELRTLYIHAVT